MVDVNRTPLNTVPQQWAFDPEIGPFIRSLLEQIRQLRERTGGDNDTVQASDSASSTNFYAANSIPEFNEEAMFFEELADGQDSGGFDLFSQLFEDEVLKGEKSANNNSTTPLSGGATFTGTAEINDYPEGFVSGIADEDGTAYAEISNDGTNWDTSIPLPTTAGRSFFLPVIKGPRYFRVRYVNGAAAQTEFRLYSYFTDRSLPYTVGNSAVIPKNAPTTLTRIIEPILDIAKGHRDGLATVQKFGRAPDGVQSTLTDIWDRADSTPTQQIWLAPTAARTHQIVSASTDDASGGIGARTVRIWGLVDWDTPEVSEDITMNGTTNVPTTNAYVIIHRMRVVSSGASGPNVGSITATADTDTTITAVILATKGTTAMAIYGWPSTKTLYINAWDCSINKSSGSAAHINFRLKFNEQPEDQPAVFVEIDITGRQSNGSSSGQEIYPSYLNLPGPGILKVSAVGSVNDLDADAGFSGILVDND